MTAYKAVPLLVYDYLQPSQIHLHKRGATPLPCLEQDDTHGSSRHAVILHQGEQTALRGIEQEADAASRTLILDCATSNRPELKVVLYAQAVECDSAERGAPGVVAKHGNRQHQAVYPLTLAATTLTREWIVGGLEHGVAAGILIDYLSYCLIHILCA